MKKIALILFSVFITALNINSYGELDSAGLEEAKLLAKTDKEIVLTKTTNWVLGASMFKLIYFAELMFVSEISRKSIIN